MSRNALAGLQQRARPLGVAVGLAGRVAVRQPGRDLGRWLCRELEALGPTYVKIGQFVSGRRDVFGEELTAELAGLRDRVRSMPADEARRALQGVRPHLASVDPEPLAAASIAQVHAARLAGSGRRVAVKVRRPGVEQRLRDDIAFMRAALRAAELTSAENAAEAHELLDDFERAVLREVDFRAEAASLQRFRELHDDGAVVVPRVHAHLCTPDALVMDFVDAVPLAQYAGDRKALARRVMSTFVRQLTTTGMVHGDPHAGNLQVTRDGRLVLFDFGSVLHVEHRDRQRLKELIYYLLANNKPAVAATLRGLGIRVTDEPALHAYLDVYMQYLRTLDVQKFRQLGRAVQANAPLPFKLTGQVFHLVRVFGTLEGLCKELDPDFDYFGVLQEHAADFVLDHDFLVYKSAADLEALLSRVPRGPVALTSPPPPTELASPSIPNSPISNGQTLMWAQLGMLALLLLKL